MRVDRTDPVALNDSLDALLTAIAGRLVAADPIEKWVDRTYRLLRSAGSVDDIRWDAATAFVRLIHTTYEKAQKMDIDQFRTDHNQSPAATIDGFVTQGLRDDARYERRFNANLDEDVTDLAHLLQDIPHDEMELLLAAAILLLIESRRHA